jgi:uncharacterized protein (DUF58 family)
MSRRAEVLGVPCELAAAQFEVTLRRLADDLTYGSDSSRFVGAGVDFAQSRPFVYGDSVRHIDWRVSARTGRVHVKEFEATKRATMYLLVDTSASMGVSSTALSKHDAAVWVAGALALVGLRRRSPVAIVSCGERGGGASPTLARGLVLRWLEGLREPSMEEQTRLTERLAQVEALARHTALVVVISDLHEPGASEAIKRVAQRHDVVVIQLRDPAEAGLRGAGFVRAVEAETGRSFVAGPRARFGTEEGWGGAGVDQVELRTDEAMIPVLRRVLASHGRGMRSPR